VGCFYGEMSSGALYRVALTYVHEFGVTIARNCGTNGREEEGVYVIGRKARGKETTKKNGALTDEQ
jgi:hypothetical protein